MDAVTREQEALRSAYADVVGIRHLSWTQSSGGITVFGEVDLRLREGDRVDLAELILKIRHLFYPLEVGLGISATHHGARFSGHTHASMTPVHPSGILLDPLGLVPCGLDDGRLLDKYWHDVPV